MSQYDDFDREKFYRNLKYLAKKHKMTMKILSEKIDISEGYLAKVGNKDSKIVPGINTIQRIMHIFNVTFEQLFYEELSGIPAAAEYDEVALLQDILEKTRKDELDWEQAKFDENTNCPQEELFDLVPWNEETGIYTYKSGFTVPQSEQRQARLPFYLAKTGENKGIILAGYSLYEEALPDFDELIPEHFHAKSNGFFEVYIYLDSKVYPVAENNPKYENKGTVILVNSLVKSVEDYVKQRKKRVIFKNFFDKEAE